MKLSVIIIAKNEAEIIKGCLDSIKGLADEIILVDNNSTDETAAIAKNTGAKVIKASGNYSTLRNAGLKTARGNWILYLDADERLPPALTKEINSVINSHSPAASYKFPRKNIIFGRWIKHGGYWPDPVHRLFKKTALKKWTGKLHESPAVIGQVGWISIPIKHYTVRSITAALDKSKHWAEIEARLLFEAHMPRVTWWRLIKAFSFKLFSQLITRGGILDGMPGLILAYIQAIHQASVLINLWQLQQQKS